MRNPISLKTVFFAVVAFLGSSQFDLVGADAPKTEQTSKITVAGSNSAWATIATIKPHTLIKVHADGSVNFGGHFATDDDAIAGVQGNAIGKWFQSLTDSNWEGVVKDPKKYPSVVNHAFGGSKPVNFNQGGVWIEILDHKTGAVVSPPQLYYYWAKALNDIGFVYGSPVDVLAKAHDGGKGPDDNPDAYSDNTGSYHVWLEVTEAPTTSYEIPPGAN